MVHSGTIKRALWCYCICIVVSQNICYGLLMLFVLTDCSTEFYIHVLRSWS